MSPHEITAQVDGRRLYGLLAGDGKTTVVLDAGLGGSSAEWSKIQTEVARFSKVVSYDRAGLGRSDKAPIPRTCKDIIHDLRSFLLAAALRPPYVLVAHSWSGLNARWYANQYPDEIAGMVLIDAVHESKYERFEKVLSDERAQRMWAAVLDPSKNDEHIDRAASIQQVQSTRDALYSFPLIVLTRADVTDELHLIETSLQADFLKLSTKSWQYRSRYPDHHIQVSEPELVIDSIHQIVEIVATVSP